MTIAIVAIMAGGWLGTLWFAARYTIARERHWSRVLREAHAREDALVDRLMYLANRPWTLPEHEISSNGHVEIEPWSTESNLLEDE